MATPRTAAKPARLPPTKRAEEPAHGFKVKAIELGYYNHLRRREGDVFRLKAAADFSEKWMVKVAETTPEKTSSSQQELDRKHDEILAGRMPQSGSNDAPTGDVDPLAP